MSRAHTELAIDFIASRRGHRSLGDAAHGTGYDWVDGPTATSEPPTVCLTLSGGDQVLRSRDPDQLRAGRRGADSPMRRPASWTRPSPTTQGHRAGLAGRGRVLFARQRPAAGADRRSDRRLHADPEDEGRLRLGVFEPRNQFRRLADWTAVEDYSALAAVPNDGLTYLNRSRPHRRVSSTGPGPPTRASEVPRTTIMLTPRIELRAMSRRFAVGRGCRGRR
jgi:hypothetical protein